MGRLIAVNVVHEVIPGHRRETAIDKRPCAGGVEVTRLGLVGDAQCDRRFHGGPEKAVYAYGDEDNAWWAALLGRDISPGTFGENLTIAGLDVGAARIGEVWRIGDVVLEVRSPRTPCTNLSVRMELPRFHQRFKRSGRVGAYLRVLRSGTLRAGLDVEVVSRPGHDVTISAWTRPTVALAHALQGSGIDLAAEVSGQVERTLARAAR